MKTRSVLTGLLALVLIAGVTDSVRAQSAQPVTAPSAVSAAQPARTEVRETRTEDTRVANPADTGIPSSAPSTTWTVFGMDQSAGVMIGVVLMMVFILAIVAVSRNERTTVI